MTIHVVCQCGFTKDVPDEWHGMRVKCKCGRSFVISLEGGVQEPPVAAPPRPPGATPPIEVGPPRESAGQRASEPPVKKTPAQRRSDSVSARYHARHDPADARRRLVLGGGVVVALVCLGAFVFVLRDRLFSDSLKPQPEETVAQKEKSVGDQEDKDKRAEATRKPDAKSDLEAEAGRFDTSVAETIELQADDALVLTGLFGDGYQQLDISDEQAAKIDELTAQFNAHAEKLVAGELVLEQWYVEGDKVGSELLELLTDQQRTNLKKLIAQKQVKRSRLEEYAAKLRPELVTPSIAWQIEPDAATQPMIDECTITGTSNGEYLYTTSATGTLGFGSGPPGNVKYQLWDLLGNKPRGTCTIPPPGPGDITRIAQDGRYVVRGGKESDGGYRVQVWKVDSHEEPRSRTLPSTNDGSDPAQAYELVDCVANRVLCVSGNAFWAWNLDTDEAREVDYPEWVPVGRPVCAISPAGQYVVMTHRHSPIVNSRQYNFVEVAIHDLDTGDLLGNQVVATDYRPMHIGAIAFSYNGRGLALLWDIDPPEPQRMLVHMNVSNGRVIRIVGDIPVAQAGYARQHDLPQRDLIWLPNDNGWIVNMQFEVDTESDAAVDIGLPAAPSGTPSESPQVKHIIDAIPADAHRLLLIIAEPDAAAPSAQRLTSQFIELPPLGPFL